MTADRDDLLTPAEAAIVAGVPVRAVYRIAGRRLPKAAVVRRAGRILLTRAGVVCLRLDRDLPRALPAGVRRFVYRQVEARNGADIEYGVGALRYIVDPRPAAAAVSNGIAGYRDAMRWIVEDPQIQGGAATFRGTRILVHHIVALLAQDIPLAELREDYPRLSDEMLAAARIFARAHPRRGRPRSPSWRKAAGA